MTRGLSGERILEPMRLATGQWFCDRALACRWVVGTRAAYSTLGLEGCLRCFAQLFGQAFVVVSQLIDLVASLFQQPSQFIDGCLHFVAGDLGLGDGLVIAF